MEQLPRELKNFEKEFLSYILPEDKKGYKEFKDKISGYKVSSAGRLNDSAVTLCKENSEPDPDFKSGDIFAAGIIIFENNTADVTVTNLSGECAELDISFEKDPGKISELKIVNKWSYSDWNSGDPAPGDKTKVREIEIIKKEFLLAAAPVHKKMWLNEAATGINHLIPVSNFYANLMMVKGIRDPAVALKPSSLFEDIDKYSDEELRSAFFLYNRYFKKFRITVPVPGKINKKENSFFRYFRKG